MAPLDDESFLPFGPRTSESSNPTPTLHLRALQLYHQAWKAYGRAGCPYGETDEAMLVWYSLPASDPQETFLTGRN